MALRRPTTRTSPFDPTTGATIDPNVFLNRTSPTPDPNWTPDRQALGGFTPVSPTDPIPTFGFTLQTPQTPFGEQPVPMPNPGTPLPTGSAPQPTPVFPQPAPPPARRPSPQAPGGGQGGQQPTTSPFVNGINRNSFLASVAGLDPTAESLRSWWGTHRGILEAQGYGFIDHPRDPALVLPDGTHIDLIQGAGAPGAQWQWLVKDLGRSVPSGGRQVPLGGGGGQGGRQRPGLGTIPANPNVPFPGTQIEVGQDPLSEDITGALRSLLDRGLGERGSDLFENVMGIIERGGDLDEDAQLRRFESARELLDRGRTAQTNQIEANLAARGLLSEPGIPQGAERTALTRLESRLGEDFARALRDIGVEGQRAADARLTSALATATGLATTEARTILDAIGAGTGRQAMLADVALQTLDRNILWNQFLAEFGLQRDLALEMLQSGRINDLLRVFQQFQAWTDLARSGQVGEP